MGVEEEQKIDDSSNIGKVVGGKDMNCVSACEIKRYHD
jgi:hypothetical protein